MDDIIATWESRASIDSIVSSRKQSFSNILVLLLVSFHELESCAATGEFEMFNEEGECVGTLDVNVEFEEGDGK